MRCSTKNLDHRMMGHDLFRMTCTVVYNLVWAIENLEMQASNLTITVCMNCSAWPFCWEVWGAVEFRVSLSIILKALHLYSPSITHQWSQILEILEWRSGDQEELMRTPGRSQEWIWRSEDVVVVDISAMVYMWSTMSNVYGEVE